MRDQLINFDKDKQKLPPYQVGSEYVNTIILRAVKIAVPINAKSQCNSSKKETDGVSSNDNFNLFLSLSNVLITYRFKKLIFLIWFDFLCRLFFLHAHMRQYLPSKIKSRNVWDKLSHKTSRTNLNQVIITVTTNNRSQNKNNRNKRYSSKDRKKGGTSSELELLYFFLFRL